MKTFYEVWDDDSNNRVGGPFATPAEAESLLGDVMRVSGPEAARDMAIVLWRERTTGGFDVTTVLEGTAFVDRTSGVAAVGGAVTGSSGGAGEAAS
jgi:hypothetical protein